MAKLGEVCKVSPSTKNIERQGAWLLNLDMVEQQTGRVVCIKGGLAPSGKLPGGCESLIVVPPGRKRERGDAS